LHFVYYNLALSVVDVRSPTHSLLIEVCTSCAWVYIFMGGPKAAL